MAMKFAWYVAVCQYIVNKTYPAGSDVNMKAKIRYQANRFYVNPIGKLFDNLNREVLHDGNALEMVTRVHCEGHLGIINTLEKVKKSYYLKGARGLIEAVVSDCETCQFRARVRFLRSNKAVVPKTPLYPFRMISVDAVGPLNETKGGKRYILTAICNFTRYPIAEAVKKIDEETTYEFLYKKIFTVFGVAERCLSDRGSNFVSEYILECLKRMGCKKVMTTAYRPNVNGVCESLNGRLISIMAKLARDDDKREEWDLYLDSALMLLRSMKNSSTGFSPSYLLFGYEFLTPSVWVNLIGDFVEGEENEYLADRVAELRGKMKDVRDSARKKSDESKRLAKIRYDKLVHEQRFQAGDEVLLLKKVTDSKLGDRWEGPFTVLSINEASGTYYLTGKNSLKLKHPVNGDRLKKYTKGAVARLIPEVATVSKEVEENFQVWLENRVKNSLNVVEVSFDEEESNASGAVRDKC